MALPQIKRAPQRPESIKLVLGGFLAQKRGFCKTAESVVCHKPRGNMALPHAVAGRRANPYMGAVFGAGRPNSKSGAYQP